jgi:uncharacterized membrane protein
MQNNPVGKTSFLGLDSNVAALLCYILTPCCLLGLILSLILFFTEKENRFVRFHAMQELLLVGIGFCFGVVFGILARLMIVSDAGILVLGLLGLRIIIGLIFLAIYVFAGIQAYQNKWFKLPIIGDMAEKWSNA